MSPGLPGLTDTAVRARHRGRDRSLEEVAAQAGVDRAIVGTTGVAHPALGRMDRLGPGLRVGHDVHPAAAAAETVARGCSHVGEAWCHLVFCPSRRPRCQEVSNLLPIFLFRRAMRAGTNLGVRHTEEAMDPSRKRRVRLVTALTIALLLAGALVYTSFTAASPERIPSQLSTAQAGQSYKLGGKVVAGSVKRTPDSMTFQVQDPKGPAKVNVSYTGVGARPVPRGPRGHRRRCSSRATASSGERDSLVTKCPSKFTGRHAELRPRLMAIVGRACLILGLAVVRVRHRRRRSTARAAAGRTGSSPAAAPSTRWRALTTAAFAILEIAFLRSDFSFAVVASHSSTTTPLFYRRPRRGPRRRARCCCGCFLLSIWSSLVLFLDAPAPARGRAYATAVLLGFGAFFGGLLVFVRVAVRRARRSPPPRARASTRSCATRA